MANLVSDSGASRMDYSARGDFPSIAVSINRLPQPTIHYPPPTIHHIQSTIHNPQPTIHHIQSTIRNQQITIRNPHHFEKTSSSLDWTGSVCGGRTNQDIWAPCSFGEVFTEFKTQHLAKNNYEYYEFRGLGFAVVTVGLFLAFFYNVVVSE